MEQRDAGLRVSGVDKTFPGVRALHEFSLRIEPGTVHALLGHNGCGKSTFVKLLAGFHQPDRPCEAVIDGASFELGSAEEATRAGISFVHQELGLVNELGAADNIGLALGYAGSPARIDWRQQTRVAEELLGQFDIDLDPSAPLSEATPTARTAVAIARATAGWQRGRGLLVLDEPTAALPAKEVQELFRIMRTIRASGTPILLISHRLDEVAEIADAATVMRSGEVIWTGTVAATSVKPLATLIAGAEVEALEEEPRRRSPVAAAGERPLLELRDLHGRYLRGISTSVTRGEIVGVAGLLGSGMEELPYIVAGARSEGVSGEILIDGQPLAKQNVDAAQACGVVLIPADRASEGIFAEFNVRENVSLAALPTLRTANTVIPANERRFAREWLSQVRADETVSERPIMTLSGGNQQKALLARWLSVEPRLLAVSEPTAGIDIGSRAGIYEELRKRADAGLTVLMSSSDVEDLVAACDRVLVLRDGRIAADLRLETVTKQGIVTAMEGVEGVHQA